MLRYILLSLAIAAFILPTQPALAQANTHAVVKTTYGGTLTEKEKVQQLISYIRQMKGAIFIRNGSEYSCQEAAEHLQAKWQKHNSKIKDANAFIEHLASKSSMSGKAYQIRFSNGKVYTTSAVLHKALKEIEKNTKP